MSSFVADFDDLLNQTVTLEPRTGGGGGGYGDASYGTARAYRCYVDGTTKLVRNAQGDQVVSGSRCFMAPIAVDGTPLVSLDVQSKATLPDGTTSPIMAVDSLTDETGATYAYVVHFA